MAARDVEGYYYDGKKAYKLMKDERGNTSVKLWKDETNSKGSGKRSKDKSGLGNRRHNNPSKD